MTLLNLSATRGPAPGFILSMWSTDLSRWGITRSSTIFQSCGIVVHIHSVLQHTLGQMIDGLVCRHAGGAQNQNSRHCFMPEVPQHASGRQEQRHSRPEAL